MELDRARIVDENFKRRVLAQDFPPAISSTSPQEVGLDKSTFLALFDSQMISRHIDLMARQLREQQLGFYTIGSSGHEGNAAIAAVFRQNDMAFLHYRSGAFMVQRAKKDPSIDIIYDQILSLVASSEDPISGGRHKVFGSLPLFIPPQTSTIASHLPKALGAALSITTVKTLKENKFSKLPNDSVVLCSFGDASVNHSTAQGAFNSTQWIAGKARPLPLVWICEDNGIGISVPTPVDWIEKTFSLRSGIAYISCDGLNLSDVYKGALKAQSLARKGNAVFLHMKTVRLLGHAGSDIEFQYRTSEKIEKNEANDPLLHSARILCEQHWLSPKDIIDLYEQCREKVGDAAKRALLTPKLSSAFEIMSSIIPPHNPAKITVSNFHHQPDATNKNMAQSINLALNEVLTHYPNTIVFGEDVGKKGGVYRVTADLQKKFGQARVFDTLLDEQTILGTAIGYAHNGFIPIPEIQFLAYTHNAADQIRGEAATLSFFSKGQYTNPMVIRIPALAYQKGFGGHFHNDNAIAFLREIPGIVIACPSTPSDAAKLLHACVQLANNEQRVVIFLEPIALYMIKDLNEQEEGPVHFGELGIEGDETSDIVIISYGNGMHLSRIAASKLKEHHKISVKLIDLRWLAPLNTQTLIREIKGKSKVLIVDECRRTGSLSEQIVTCLVENMSPLPTIKRLTAEDSFIPLGQAWEFILPSSDKIIESVLGLNKRT